MGPNICSNILTNLKSVTYKQKKKMCLNIKLVYFLTVYCSLVSGEDVTVTTDIGTIIGKVSLSSFNGTPITVSRFLGIPFAEPPIGDKRFLPPITKADFTEPFNATTMSPWCLQNMALFNEPVTIVQSEDCLYLNILVPGATVDSTQRKAVMIWIYGGGFEQGGQDMYTSSSLAAIGDIILVTLNYRVSVFGFLSTGNQYLPGNYGLWDQHMAIQWVHDHIDKFGGDPAKVTIFGESAGAASVIYQALYEGNKGMFQRVIAQSGSINSAWGINTNPEENFDTLTNKSNCIVGTLHSVIKCLRNKPASELQSVVFGTSRFAPVFDGTFVKVRPSEVFQNKTETAREAQKLFGKLDFMTGFNSDEGGPYMSSIDNVLSTNGDHSKGYKLEEFEMVIIPKAFRDFPSKPLTSVMHKAIVHQYIDWNEPSNTYLVRQGALDMISDMIITAGVVKMANAHSDTGQTGRTFLYVYDYQLSYLPQRWYYGAVHEEELPVVFGLTEGIISILSNESLGDPGNFTSSTDILMSRRIMEYWTNFAKTG